MLSFVDPVWKRPAPRAITGTRCSLRRRPIAEVSPVVCGLTTIRAGLPSQRSRGLSDRAGVQRAVLELHIENAKLVARAIDPFAVGEPEHIIVPAAADHPVAALQKRIVQRLLLMRTAALDAAEARRQCEAPGCDRRRRAPAPEIRRVAGSSPASSCQCGIGHRPRRVGSPSAVSDIAPPYATIRRSPATLRMRSSANERSSRSRNSPICMVNGLSRNRVEHRRQRIAQRDVLLHSRACGRRPATTATCRSRASAPRTRPNGSAPVSPASTPRNATCAAVSRFMPSGS